MDSLFTIEEAASFLRIKTSTLRQWRHENRGPRCIKLGRRLLYAKDDIEAFLNMKRNETEEAIA